MSACEDMTQHLHKDNIRSALSHGPYRGSLVFFLLGSSSTLAQLVEMG